MITLTSFGEARDAFRNRDLRQALYDAGDRLMHGVIVNLHGDEHIARRRLENRLFRRDTFAWYERERIPTIVEAVLADPLLAGRGDLLPIARRTMMTLSTDVAGVDLGAASNGHDEGSAPTASDFERFSVLMEALARASTVAHAVGDPEDIIRQGDAALATFERNYFNPSLERRQSLIEQHRRGQLADADLPRDVLTTLLQNQDRLDLPDATVLREIAYFPWVGSHSTAAQLVHAMHHIFEWIAEHPESRHELEHDDILRQQFVHESMRLHPASPVAMRHATCDVTLKTGRSLPAGAEIAISVHDANRDPAAFPEHPDEFDPYRIAADGVARWGLSFGHGTQCNCCTCRIQCKGFELG